MTQYVYFVHQIHPYESFSLHQTKEGTNKTVERLSQDVINTLKAAADRSTMKNNSRVLLNAASDISNDFTEFIMLKSFYPGQHYIIDAGLDDGFEERRFHITIELKDINE